MHCLCELLHHRCIWHGCTNWQIHPRFELLFEVTRVRMWKSILGLIGGTKGNCCTVTCNLVCTDPLMHLDHTAKTRSVWPTLQVKIAHWNKWAWTGMFKPTEPHSPACPRLSCSSVTASNLSCDFSVASLMAWCHVTAPPCLTYVAAALCAALGAVE